MTIIEKTMEVLRGVLKDKASVTCKDTTIYVRKNNYNVGVAFKFDDADKEIKSSEDEYTAFLLVKKILTVWNDEQSNMDTLEKKTNVHNAIESKSKFLEGVYVVLYSDIDKVSTEWVHKKIENTDLVLGIRLFLQDGSNSNVISVAVNKELLNTVGVTEDEVWEKAMENSLVTSDIQSVSNNNDAERISNILQIPPTYKDFVFSVSTKSNLNTYGASAVIHEEVLSDLHKKMGTKEVAVIPFCVHEVVTIPSEALKDKDFMERVKGFLLLARLFSCTEIEKGNRFALSNKIYVHDLERGWRIYE